jgi:hypothetical protein
MNPARKKLGTVFPGSDYCPPLVKENKRGSLIPTMR